ncbi:alpha-amylase [Bifidobacterium porcinum]|nr:alpha-amylase [Bifidobacterium porcinum]
MFRKLAAAVLAVATMFGGMALGSTTASAATSSRDSYTDTLGNADFEAARSKYGLTKDMKNGAILHAWMWSFNTIKNNMKAIAEAGYTSVQTEPMSAIKANPANGKKFAENWYYVYQPTDTTIGNFVVGSEQDLKDMCAEAHKYGVRIIVDVVANHFTSDWNAIGSDWKDASLFHSRTNCPGKNGDQINYSNRWQVTHCHLLGLWDINTENQTAANKMKDFLVQAVNDGVDGFRFDAAKHVELPDEFPQHSVYWETILKNGAQYQYGEVLQGDNGLNYTGYTNMFTQYSSDGGGATASDYGKTVRAAISSSNLNAGNLSSLRSGGAKDDQLVTWVESHDNYANGDKESTHLNDYQLRMGWAIIGSRAGGAPLYFNRPVGSGGNKPQFAEQSQLGDAGDNMWKDKAVVAVNHFRNKMNGNSEYLRNCQSQNSCLMVERYDKDGNADDDGVVIANMGGDVNLAGSDTTLDNGTYTDQVNGGTLTVSGGKITSGTATAGKVSVFYNMKTNVASVSATGSASFKTDTTTVTLHAANVTGAKYTTSEGKSGSYNDGDVITVGANTAVGSAVTVTVSGTDADGKTVTATFTFQKKDPTAVTVVYAKKPSSWSSLYAYVYVDDPSATSLTQNAKWPGVAMTAADACGKNAGYDYMYEIPDNFEGTVRVIFNDGNATNTTKYPADSTTGEDAAGLQVTGTSAWNGDTSASTSGALKSISCTTTTVKSVTIKQSDFSLDVSNGAATKKLTATTDPAGAAVTWSSSDDSVASVASDGTVTAKKAGAATITATAGGKSDSIKVTVTDSGSQGGGSQGGGTTTSSNYLYVKKPAGWKSVYAYIYNGEGSSATSNAKWPGEAMTAMTTADSCASAGTYRIEVPNLGTGTYRVIFSDNGSNSNRYPADMTPGLEFTRGTAVQWDGSSTTLSAVTCKTPDVPVSSVAVSGSGVSNGKLSLEKGKSAQLSATVNPSDATNKTVTWSSSDASVASVTGTGYVSAVKAGTATVTASAGGKSASVKVTVEAQDPYAQLDALAKAHASDLEDGTYTVSTALKDGMVLDVAGGSKSDRANVQLGGSNGGANQKWRVSHDSKGYVTLANVNSGKVLDVAGGSARNGANALQYSSNGGRNQKWVAVRSGSSYRLVSALSRSLVLDVAGWSTKNGANVDVWASNGGANQQWKFANAVSGKPMTVWYRPDSSWKKTELYYRTFVGGESLSSVAMEKACGGWYKAVVPDSKGGKVRLAFTDGSEWDTGGMRYYATGDSAAVAGGQVIADVTPNCVATTKQ